MGYSRPCDGRGKVTPIPLSGKPDSRPRNGGVSTLFPHAIQVASPTRIDHLAALNREETARGRRIHARAWSYPSQTTVSRNLRHQTPSSITSATWAAERAVRQNSVESLITLPPRVRPRWAEMFMKA